MQKLVLYVSVFIAGFALMSLEILAVRIISPYFGYSVIVWTNVIGLILAAMSIGYWIGGRWVEKSMCDILYGSMFVIVAIWVLLISIWKELFLLSILQNFEGVALGSFMVSLVFFVVPSFVFGAISPMSVQLISKNNIHAAVVGNVSAMYTIGSIVGTFLTGIFLLPLWGTNTLLLILVLVMSFISLLLASIVLKRVMWLIIISFLVLLLSSYYLWVGILSWAGAVADVDTPYNRVVVLDSKYQNHPTRFLMFDFGGGQSGQYKDSDELVFDYTKMFQIDEKLMPQAKNTLMLGGGTYTYPTNFISRFTGANIDVVEIDPELLNISKKYFRFIDNDRINTYAQDAKWFVSKASSGQYDIVYMDVFNSRYTIPYFLVTKEYAHDLSRIINTDGYLIFNVIAKKDSEYLASVIKTFATSFPNIKVYDPHLFYGNLRSEGMQNVIVVASKKDIILPDNYITVEINIDRSKGVVFDSDFAVADLFLAKGL